MKNEGKKMLHFKKKYTTSTIGLVIAIIVMHTYTLLSNKLAMQKPITIPLFKKFPILANNIPYISLGTLPTPIKHLISLGNANNCTNLYLKDDGKTGTLFGGNKVRKLEFLLADARHKNCTHIVTVGGAGSNHATATTIYAKQLGLTCSTLLLKQLNTSSVLRNLLLMQANNAQISYFTHEEDFKTLNDMFLHHPFPQTYFIPVGGSNPIGTLGFVNAAFELKEQIEQGWMPEPDIIYLPLGSCGTAVGLALGMKLAGLKTHPIFVTISKPHEKRVAMFINLFNQTSAYLHSLDAPIPLMQTSADQWEFNARFGNTEYAENVEEISQAIQQLFKTEGIKIDATYAGRVFTAMVHDLATNNHKDKVVLFWNTFCSEPFSQVTSTTDYKQLPQNLHTYFESPLDPLDQGI